MPKQVGEMHTHRNTSVVCVVAGLVVGAGVLSACSGARDTTTAADPGETPLASASPQVPPADMVMPQEAGRYAFTTDSDLDHSYLITMDVPRGWDGSGGNGHVIGKGSGQGISAWGGRNVYADPCAWQGTLADPSVDSAVNDLVAALADQKGRHATAPTNVTLDGYNGKYIELTTPAGIDLAACDEGQFRSWVGRFTEPGQRDMLWIVDVDGEPLVIDAALGKGTTRQDRVERTQIAQSTQIQPL